AEFLDETAVCLAGLCADVEVGEDRRVLEMNVEHALTGLQLLRLSKDEADRVISGRSRLVPIQCDGDFRRPRDAAAGDPVRWSVHMRRVIPEVIDFIPDDGNRDIR